MPHKNLMTVKDLKDMIEKKGLKDEDELNFEYNNASLRLRRFVVRSRLGHGYIASAVLDYE